MNVVDKRLRKVKGLREVYNRVEAASDEMKTAREDGQRWEEKLSGLNEEMVNISAAAYNDQEPAALKRATELEQEIHHAEYAISGLLAREAAAKSVLAFELSSQEKLAAKTATKELKSIGKKIAKMQQTAKDQILALAETTLQIKKLTRECEILAADYGVDTQGIRWSRTSRPIKEWMMCLFNRKVVDLAVDTSRVAEHQYQNEIGQVLDTDEGLGISALVEKIKNLNVRSAKERRLKEALNASQ